MSRQDPRGADESTGAGSTPVQGDDRASSELLELQTPEYWCAGCGERVVERGGHGLFHEATGSQFCGGAA